MTESHDEKDPPEAAEGVPEEPLALEELARLLPRVPLSPDGLSRLLAEVEELPLRYAPFFGRLSALWDLPEAEVEATLAHAKDERAWERTPLPGLRRLALAGGPALAGGQALLLHFAPGARFPAHRHTGSEVVLVLEGSYVDGNDRRFGPGDQQVLEAGSEHTLRISPDGPCVAAIVSHGVEFTGWLLGTLQRLWPER